MPLPKPKDTDTKDEFLGRCMANESMSGEFPDNNQRSAVCNSIWRRRKDMTVSDVVENFKARDNKAETLDVEIFSVGRWNGLDFTLQDLQGVVLAFHALEDNHHVPLKFGHNDEQPFTDGYPAIGWVSDVWLDGNKLMGRFSDVPDIVRQAFNKKLYRHVSIELEMAVEYKGQFFPWVLSGVALLGADIPAVNTLADLTALMKRDVGLVSKDRRVFTTLAGIKTDKRSESNMDELEKLKVKFKASEEAREAAEKRAKELEEQAETSKKAAELKFCADKTSELTKRLDALVEAKRIMPARREAFVKEFANDRATLERIEFAVSALEDTFKEATTTNQSLNVDKSKLLSARAGEDEAGLTADKIIVLRTNKLRAETNISFAQAKERVLRADPKLAREYIKHEWHEKSEGGAVA